MQTQYDDNDNRQTTITLLRTMLWCF